MRARRTFSREFKLAACRSITSGEKRISQVCRELDLCESVFRRWLDQYQDQKEDAFLEDAKPSQTTATPEKARLVELEAALGRAHLEIEFLRDALAKKGLLPRRQSR